MANYKEEVVIVPHTFRGELELGELPDGVDAHIWQPWRVLRVYRAIWKEQHVFETLDCQIKHAKHCNYCFSYSMH